MADEGSLIARVAGASRRSWHYCLAIFVSFAVSLSVFPALTVNVESQFKHHTLLAGKSGKWADTYFQLVGNFLLFNIGKTIPLPTYLKESKIYWALPAFKKKPTPFFRRPVRPDLGRHDKIAWPITRRETYSASACPCSVSLHPCLPVLQRDASRANVACGLSPRLRVHRYYGSLRHFKWVCLLNMHDSWTGGRGCR